MPEITIKRRRLHAGQERVKASGKRFRSCMFGRRWGKNVVGIDEAMTTALAGKRVGWFEPTYKYLLEAWRELCTRLRPVAKSVSDQEKRIELVTGGLIEAWTCDTPDPGRSRDYDLVIINEAGLIRGLLTIWQEAIRATLVKTRGRALFLGTPKGRTHDFSTLHAKAATSQDWEAFRGPTAENPFIPREEIEDARRELPPQVFAQEFEGIPADDGGNPFGLDAIKACTVETQPVGEPLCFGWDFARAQDWTVGIGLSKDFEVVRFHRWQLIPWQVQFDQIRQANGAIPSWGDSTGIGDVVVDTLLHAGVPMIGVPFSSKMKQELMERLAVAIHSKRLRIPAGPIVSELETFSYEYTAHGVRYQAPEGMHDDCVMALALAVFGRDQFGVIGQPVVTPRNQDVHPGMDYQKGERKKPWEQGWQPEVPQTGWLPNPETVKLGWD